MKITLVQKPVNPIDVIYIACRTCYSDQKISDIIEESKKIVEGEKLKLIKAIIKSGHLSVTEHISFTFAFDGMSRIITQQLVRHRMASYSQQSQRYVRIKEIIEELVDNAPPKIKNNPNRLAKYREKVELAINEYNEMVDELISEGYTVEEACENARLLLPNATPSNILITMNLRELMHVMNLRLCTRAQDEIRFAFSELRDIIVGLFPFLKEFLVPKCDRMGYCDEHKCCGRKPKKKDVLDFYYQNIKNKE